MNTTLTSRVGRRVAVGAGWMVLLRFTDRIVGLVSIVVLARLLTPGDFGLVALATSLIAVLDKIGEMSVDMALIQNQSAERRHYDTAWTLNIGKGVVLAGILVLLAAPAARFFSEPRVESVVYWLALSVTIGGFENIGIVDFRKHFEFHREYLFVITSRIVPTLLAIAFAFVWPGPWALVAGIIARRLVALALSYALHGYRPRLSLEAFGELFRFSKWVMVENLFMALRRQSHSFALGRVVGAAALGHYAMAYEIAMMASSEIEQPIRRAVFPGYAKLASDPALLRRAFLDVLGMIAALAAPLAVGVGLVANLVVPLLLGSKWLDTIPLIQILSLFGMLVVMSGGTRLVYLAVNKPHIATLVAAVEAIALVPTTVLGVLWAGTIGVAWAMVTTAAVTWVTAMAIVIRLLGLDMAQIAGRLWRVVIALLGMAAAVWVVQGAWTVEAGFVATGALLAVCVVVGGLVYAGVLFALWQLSGRPEGVESQLLDAGYRALAASRRGWWKRHVEDVPSVEQPRSDGS